MGQGKERWIVHQMRLGTWKRLAQTLGLRLGWNWVWFKGMAVSGPRA